MNLFYRRNRFGLGTLRAVSSKMSNSIKITNDDVPTNFSSLYNIFTWGNVRRLPTITGECNKNIYNKDTLDKAEFRKKISESSLMRSLRSRHNSFGIVPTQTGNIQAMYNFARNYASETLILRPNHHHGGSGFHIIDGTLDEKFNKIRTHYSNGSYLSVYIPKVREFRVMVMNSKVLFMIEKIVENKDTYAWNVSLGGRMVNVRWSEWIPEVAKIAIVASEITGADYAAYDVIVDANGVCYVLEENKSPRVEEQYWSTCLAKGFDYIIDNNIAPKNYAITSNSDEQYTIMRSRYDLLSIYKPDFSDWKYLIHPAISKDAFGYSLMTLGRSGTLSDVISAIAGNSYEDNDSLDEDYYEDEEMYMVDNDDEYDEYGEYYEDDYDDDDCLF